MFLQENSSHNVSDFETPLFPVNTGNEKEANVVPKFSYEKLGQMGKLIVEPEDLEGNFDFIADVESMALNSGKDEQAGRDQAMKTILTSPNALQLLQQENVKPKFKQLLIAWLIDNGFKDAEQYFESADQGGGDSLSKEQEMIQKTSAPPPQKPPATAINYKDLPPEGQTQLAQQAGIQIGGGTAGQGPQPTGATMTSTMGGQYGR